VKPDGFTIGGDATVPGGARGVDGPGGRGVGGEVDGGRAGVPLGAAVTGTGVRPVVAAPASGWACPGEAVGTVATCDTFLQPSGVVLLLSAEMVIVVDELNVTPGTRAAGARVVAG